MSIQFENTAYFRAATDGFPIEQEIATGNPRFKYGNVSYQNFSQRYSPKDGLLSKVTAIPVGLCVGLTKAIYDLALALFVGIAKSPWDGGKSLKLHFFAVARDFQWMGGRFISVGHEALGAFNQQEALFQKSCYECTLSHTFRPGAKNPPANPTGHPSAQSGKSTASEGNLTKREPEPLAKELTKVSANEIPALFRYLDSSQTNRARFALLGTKDVQSALEKDLLNGRRTLSLVSKEQLRGLNLSKLSKQTIDDLFHYLNNTKTDQDRFALLDTKGVQSALEKGLLSGRRTLSLVSKEQLKGLSLSKFPEQSIDDLFSHLNNTITNQNRFAMVASCEVNAALIKDKLSSRVSRLISNAQLKKIDFSALSMSALYKVFEPSLRALRLAQLSEEQKEEVNRRLEERTSSTPPPRSSHRSTHYPGYSRMNAQDFFDTFFRFERGGSFNPSGAGTSFFGGGDPFANLFGGGDPFASFGPSASFFGGGRNGPHFHYTRTGPNPSAGSSGDQLNKTPEQKKEEALKTLGLTSSASASDIKKAYHKQARQHHPDKTTREANETDKAFKTRQEKAAEKFKKILGAYDYLTKPKEAPPQEV